LQCVGPGFLRWVAVTLRYGKVVVEIARHRQAEKETTGDFFDKSR